MNCTNSICFETFTLWCSSKISFERKKKIFYDLIHTAFSFMMRVRSLRRCHCKFVPVRSNHIKHHHEHDTARANKISTVTFSVCQMFAVELAKGELTFQWDHQIQWTLFKSQCIFFIPGMKISDSFNFVSPLNYSRTSQGNKWVEVHPQKESWESLHNRKVKTGYRDDDSCGNYEDMWW